MEKFFQYGGQKIPYDITYSNRRKKSMGIAINDSGVVHIAAPAGLSEKEILRKLEAGGEWILKKLDEMQHPPAPGPKSYKEGQSLLVMGEELTLQLVIEPTSDVIMVKQVAEKLIVTTPADEDVWVREALEGWYRNKAGAVIRERVGYYQPIVGVKPVNIRIKEQKRRWGSCSSLGNLNFNWRLAMAPQPVVDYVLVHELCHLIHLNHSKEFWSLVQAVLPDYEQRRQWLKKNGGKLGLP